MQTQKLIRFSLPLSLLAVSAVALHAQIITPITVNDSLFTSPTVSQGSVGFLEGTNHITGVPYNDGGDFSTGITNPNPLAFNRGANNILPGTAGSAQALYMQGFSTEAVATYQGSLGNFVAGDTYTLTVAIGDALNDVSTQETGGTYHLDLLENGNSVAATTGTATVGNFTDLTLTFTASSSDTGAIGFDLGFSSPTGFKKEGFFDNVRLTQEAAAVPEPSSLALVAAGTLAAIAMSLHRRRTA